MTRSLALTYRAMTLVAAAALLPSLPQGQSAPPSAPYTYQGTVQEVQSKTASLDLVTGVGYALRLVHIRTVASTHMESAGATLALADIKPGDIVRAVCRMADTALVADSIQKLASAGAAPAVKP